jgi:multicomponent Na+:H+ antiporter subunit D
VITLHASLPLAVAAPLLGGALSPLLARLHRRLALLAGMLSMLFAGVVLGIAAFRVYHRGQALVEFFSNERPVSGRVLGITFVADPFGISFACLTVLLGLFLFVSLLSEFGEIGSKELGGLAALCQLLLAALVAAALTADTINLFVWFEVAALSSYGLTGFFLERPIALEAAFKMSVLTSMAGFAVFLGTALLYQDRGALNFGQLHTSLSGHLDRPVLLGFALLLAGYATKAGLAPFHGWLPDAHTPVPGAVSALFSGLMVNLGVIGLVRLGVQVFPSHGHRMLGLLTALGLVSALLGALLALVQDDLKRLLAWDTVSQMGLLIVGFASSTAAGDAGAVLHLVNHALFKGLLFLCAGAVVHATGVTDLSQMGGILARRPVLGIAFTAGVLSIAGVPCFNGYVSLDLIHSGLEHQPVVLWLARLAQVITVAALFRAAYLGFLRRRREPYERFDRPRTGMQVSLLSLAGLCVALGVFGHPIVRTVAEPAAGSLLHPASYAALALGRSSQLPVSPAAFSYFGAKALVPALAELLAGLLLCLLVLRFGPPAPLRALRRLHTGSVNDYAMLVTGGAALCAFVLLG